MSDWKSCSVVRDKDGGIWVANGGAWISWEEPEAVSDDWLRRYYGPLTPVRDADGHLVPDADGHLVPELLAQAWDEGWDEGWLDHIARVEVGSELTDTPNPYRKAKQ